MAPSWRLRAAVPADLAALGAVAQAAKARWGYPREWLEQWRPELGLQESDLARWRVIVAEEDGKPCGFAAGCPGQTRWTLEHCWVAPGAEGRGIGRALVLAVFDAAVAAGAQGLVIDSDPNAEGFYLRLGGSRVGRIPAAAPGAPDRTLPRLWLDRPG